MWGNTFESGAGLEAVASEWMAAHRALSRLARQRAAADAEEGRWLLAALRAAAHVHLGFGSFGEYVERLFGYSPRSTQEKLRVAEALEALPAIAGALREGAINWSAARELTRVAVAETEREWLAFSRGKSVRQLEELLAGACPGDRPSDARQPSAARHVLRFEVAAETVALFREALSQLRRRSDARLDDDALLLTMARMVLGGPRDEGRSSYQVALNVCVECGRGEQVANGELVPVGAEVVALAQCDGQHVDVRVADENDGPAHGAGLSECGAQSSPAAHAVDMPNGAHVGAAEPAGRVRAKQTIPPALRRTVLQRDHRRCRVPGCRNATFVDLHHIEPRCEGGANDVDNLITLCGAHHRAAHRGELIIDGNSSAELRFRHADGSSYGELVNPGTLETNTKVFAALRGLGFRESEVRAVLGELRQRVDAAAATPERLLREALVRLTRACAKQ